MPNLTEQRLEEIVTTAVQKAIPSPCKYNQYMNDSELSPSKHIEDHQKFHALFGFIGKAGNRFMMVVMGLITVFLLTAFGWGVIDILSKKLSQ